MSALDGKSRRSSNELNNIIWSLDSHVVDAIRIAICFENFFKVKLLLDGYIIHIIDRKVDKSLASKQYKFPIKVSEISGNISTVLTAKTIGWTVLTEDGYKQQLSMAPKLFDCLDRIVGTRNNLHYLIADNDMFSGPSDEDLFYIRTCYKEFIVKLYNDLLMEYEVSQPEKNSRQRAWTSRVKPVKVLAKDELGEWVQTHDRGDKAAPPGATMPGDWSAPIAWERACRRAGGRRHIHAMRQFKALRRRVEVAKLLEQAYTTGEIAKRLGVSRWTIQRDLRALMHPEHLPDCPACALWARVLR
jgi:Trp repressor protein